MNVLYQRSPRIKPALSNEELEIFRPPSEPAKPSFSMVSIIIPIIMTAAIIGFYVYMNMSGRMAGPNYMMLSIFMMITSFTLPFFMYLSNKKVYQKKLAERNQNYRAQLDLLREEMKVRQEDQVHTMFDIHGDPEACYQVVKNRSSRLWERSRRLRLSGAMCGQRSDTFSCSTEAAAS